MVHIRIRHATLGGHVHCSVWSASEEGASAETTHGRNGGLVFREAEFDVFRNALMIGSRGRIEFVEDGAETALIHAFGGLDDAAIEGK